MGLSWLQPLIGPIENPLLATTHLCTSCGVIRYLTDFRRAGWYTCKHCERKYSRERWRKQRELSDMQQRQHEGITNEGHFEKEKM